MVADRVGEGWDGAAGSRNRSRSDRPLRSVNAFCGAGPDVQDDVCVRPGAAGHAMEALRRRSTVTKFLSELVMPSKLEPKYCSESCKSAEMARSFGTCPLCSNTWNGRDNEHYRNGAWKMCTSCSHEQRRCVVCGTGIS
jgi:hypothetical protein